VYLFSLLTADSGSRFFNVEKLVYYNIVVKIQLLEWCQSPRDPFLQNSTVALSAHSAPGSKNTASELRNDLLSLLLGGGLANLQRGAFMLSVEGSWVNRVGSSASSLCAPACGGEGGISGPGAAGPPDTGSTRTPVGSPSAG